MKYQDFLETKIPYPVKIQFLPLARQDVKVVMTTSVSANRKLHQSIAFFFDKLIKSAKPFFKKLHILYCCNIQNTDKRYLFSYFGPHLIFLSHVDWFNE